MLHRKTFYQTIGRHLKVRRYLLVLYRMGVLKLKRLQENNYARVLLLICGFIKTGYHHEHFPKNVRAFFEATLNDSL